MKLRRSILKRKVKFQKWKDRTIYRINRNLFLNRFKDKLPLLNSKLPPIKIDTTKVSFIKNNDIPVLAWGMKISENGQVTINYGKQVCFFETGIVEGIWEDNFLDFGFDKSPYFFGSGLKIQDNDIIISPPSHFYEGLYMLYDKQSKNSYISNSLNYVLKENAESCDDKFKDMIDIICLKNDEITAKGVFDLDTVLYESSSLSIHVFYYHNLVLSSNDGKVYAKTPSAQYYKNFKEYQQYLLTILKKLHLNAIATERTVPYTTLATLSSGYDSSAVAALLKEIDEVESVTIDVNIAGNDDSGMEIAKYLDINCEACAHPLAVDNVIQNLGTFTYTQEFADKTSEFLATIGHGDEIVFQSFDNFIENKAVYTGHSGDDLWGLQSKDFIGIPITIINGKSLTEYRLRKNFFHIPLPVIGAVYPFSIYKINYQTDMRKYWVNDTYNRPIARRFIEDQGVPRGSFAKSKRSTNPYILNTDDHKVRAFQLTMDRYSWEE